MATDDDPAPPEQRARHPDPAPQPKPNPERDPGLRGLASWSLWAVLLGALLLGTGAVWGAYVGVGELVEVDTDAGITPAQRITAAFAVATAAGVLVALVVNLRKQDVSEQTTRREFDAAFTDRFASAAAQLGGAAPAERIAGVYAMAALADEHPTRRQQCLDVLCGYLRLPFDPATNHLADTSTTITQVFHDGRTVVHHENPASKPFDQQVRETITTVIRDHTQPDAHRSWSSLDYNLTGAHLTNLDLTKSRFAGHVDFYAATFSGVETSFAETMFSGDHTWFDGATFSAKTTLFNGATFSGDHTLFDGATFSGEIALFDGATFSGETTRFDEATFCAQPPRTTGVKVTFDGVKRENDATLSGLSAPRLQDGATITQDGKQFHGWE
ncbi:pentapeptide repeat-containing protein [uncultured Serinicoccus sp.]|uniref:pentapeptide repeat-containing protein n=1 Tax=uncultured Serinicoccus sp. TaxID=735514 RepID=UPI002635F2FF|nr:pentapeptide repeat-containing protein [uncultured Serinicoccus sp.]